MFTRTAAFYDALYSWKDYAAEAARLRQLIGPGPARVLDVACGTGQHLARLRAWYEVEGLDLDERLLAIARARLPEVPLRPGDMVDFELGRRFEAVLCLFSSIGYVGTPARLRRAVAAMARHVAPGGQLIVEPWFWPEAFQAGRPHALLVDQPDLKICRMATSAVRGAVSHFDFHYLVATPGGVERMTERHRLGLFTHAQYLAAFEAAGLTVEHDPVGLMGRGLYLGRRAVSAPDSSGRA